jgi:hypothetical protein
MGGQLSTIEHHATKNLRNIGPHINWSEYKASLLSKFQGFWMLQNYVQWSIVIGFAGGSGKNVKEKGMTFSGEPISLS